MGMQRDISPTMRAIVIDWLVETHYTRKLHQQTLFLSINIMDRYLSSKQLTRKVLQLIGITSLLIASKFIDIDPLGVQDCIIETDNMNDRKEIIEMESEILSTLQYQISVPTVYHFLSRYFTVVNITEKTRLLTNYYIERNLQEYDSLQYQPCKFAAGAVYAALYQQQIQSGRVLGPSKSYWPLTLEEETGLTEAEVFIVARNITQHVNIEVVTASKRVLSATKRKYSSERYQKVSNLPLTLM
jgi:cyclin B